MKRIFFLGTAKTRSQPKTCWQSHPFQALQRSIKDLGVSLWVPSQSMNSELQKPRNKKLKPGGFQIEESNTGLLPCSKSSADGPIRIGWSSRCFRLGSSNLDKWDSVGGSMRCMLFVWSVHGSTNHGRIVSFWRNVSNTLPVESKHQNQVRKPLAIPSQATSLASQSKASAYPMPQPVELDDSLELAFSWIVFSASSH